MTQKKPFWKRPSKSAPDAQVPLRTREQVQDDYNRACNEAGDLQYKLVTMSHRIDWLTKFRSRLNDEMNEIAQAEQDAAKPCEGPQTAPPPPPEAQH